MYILLLFLIIFYAFLAWRRIELALALLIFALPAYQIRFQIGLLPSTVLELMVFVLFTVWLARAAQKKELPWQNYLFFFKQKDNKNIKHYPFYVEIILLLIIAVVSTGFAGFSGASLGILKAYFIEPIMFFIVFINIFKIKENRKYIFWALSLSALFVSLVAIYQKITGDFLPLAWINTGRVTGVFAYPNALGLYLGPITMVLAGLLLSLAKNFQFSIFNFQTIINVKIFNALFICYLLSAICSSVLAIFFAQSEGALIGIAAALFVMGFLYNKWTRKTVLSLIVVGMLIMGLNMSLREPIVKKIVLMDLDGQIRRQQWSETWQMLTSSPKHFIFGAGLGNYQTAIAPFHKSGIYVRNNDPEFDKWVTISLEYQQKVWQPLEIYLYPHNIFLNFWTELGLAGMLLFVWIILRFLILDFRLLILDYRYKNIALGLMGAMTVIVIHGLVDVPYFKNDLAIIFWMLIGIMGVYQLEQAQINNKK